MDTFLGDRIFSEDIEVKKKENDKIQTPIKTENEILFEKFDDFNKGIIPVKGRLCLNMIVKNESRIIERLLSTVLPIIDTYCICDTGSTDDTPTKIREYMMKHNKPGIVFFEPFKNFGYNRSIALQKADPWGDYVLLLDADMKLVIQPEFFNIKHTLDLDGYHILQKNGDIKYYNTRIVKTGIGVKCVSPTHEYYDFPPNHKQGKLECIYIDDIGDGGSKTDKFERDIRLLKEGLIEEPKNGRYHFYLGNSYKNTGRFKEAIEWYKKRIEIGGWIEEVFYSYLEIGNSYMEMKDGINAVHYWMLAWNHHPKRAESLYEIVKYYRTTSKHGLALIFYNLGKSIPYPKDDVLFIKHQVYEFLFDYEYSILAYYTKTPINHFSYLNLLGKDYCKENVWANYRFYVRSLKDIAKNILTFNGSAEKSIEGIEDTFYSSTPCIIPYKEGYLMNVRYVNYQVSPNEDTYMYRLQDGKIRTLNKTLILNKNYTVQSEKWIDKIHNPNLRYQGVEDVKLFSYKNTLFFTGTVQRENGNLAVGFGTYDMDKDCLHPKGLESPENRFCEKNWALCTNSKNEMRVVYVWHPLQIAELEGEKLINMKTQNNIPDFFKDIRGSTNGFRCGDEVWFLCHIIDFGKSRNYYNIIIVLNAKDLTYKKHSTLFKFTNEKRIEFCLSLIIEPKQIIFGFSEMDHSSKLMIVPRNKFEEMYFP